MPGAVPEGFHWSQLSCGAGSVLWCIHRTLVRTLLVTLREALRREHDALKRERDAMAEELAALTPEFFEEVEDLRFHHAQAAAQLQQYAERFGPL